MSSTLAVLLGPAWTGFDAGPSRVVPARIRCCRLREDVRLDGPSHNFWVHIGSVIGVIILIMFTDTVIIADSYPRRGGHLQILHCQT